MTYKCEFIHRHYKILINPVCNNNYTMSPKKKNIVTEKEYLILQFYYTTGRVNRYN